MLNLYKTLEKGFEMSFSSVLPLMVVVWKANLRPNFLLGSVISPWSKVSWVLGILMQTSFTCSFSLLAAALRVMLVMLRPEPRSRICMLVSVAISVSLPMLSKRSCSWATTSRWPASKAPRLGLPVFRRGLWLSVKKHRLSMLMREPLNDCCLPSALTSRRPMRRRLSTGPFLVCCTKAVVSSVMMAFCSPRLFLRKRKLPS